MTRKQTAQQKVNNSDDHDVGEKTLEQLHAKSKKTLEDRTFHNTLLMASFVVFWFVFFGLLLLQIYMAYLSRRSQEVRRASRALQVLSQLTTSKRDMPPNVYSLYFDYLEWGPDMDQVDLRANTSIFVH